MEDVSKGIKAVTGCSKHGSNCLESASESDRGPWNETCSDSGSVRTAKETEKRNMLQLGGLSKWDSYREEWMPTDTHVNSGSEAAETISQSILGTGENVEEVQIVQNVEEVKDENDGKRMGEGVATIVGDIGSVDLKNEENKSRNFIDRNINKVKLKTKSAAKSRIVKRKIDLKKNVVLITNQLLNL